jgi:hypothetical protein
MEIKLGDMLWRQINIDENKNIFKAQKDGSMMFRASRAGAHVSTENALFADTYENKHGLVCFCKKPIPDNWIYFEVKALAKKGKAVFVEPVIGTRTSLLSWHSGLLSVDKKAVAKATLKEKERIE